MNAQCCKRCGKEEIIPTHQHVKFDLEVKDLCTSCWEKFRSWFNSGRTSQHGDRRVA